MIKWLAKNTAQMIASIVAACVIVSAVDLAIATVLGI